jgi:molybdopterin synthase catalytic subunit
MVARGALHLRAGIGTAAIDTAGILREVSANSNGAAVLFVGTVRETNDDRAVLGMEYSAYVPMAEKTLAEIASEAQQLFNTGHIVVQHRVGELELGEASVVIAVAHPHRASAFDAARYVIEELKRRVPIWKKEHYVDGTREWVDPTGGARQGEVVK